VAYSPLEGGKGGEINERSVAALFTPLLGGGQGGGSVPRPATPAAKLLAEWLAAELNT